MLVGFPVPLKLGGSVAIVRPTEQAFWDFAFNVVDHVTSLSIRGATGKGISPVSFLLELSIRFRVAGPWHWLARLQRIVVAASADGCRRHQSQAVNLVPVEGEPEKDR